MRVSSRNSAGRARQRARTRGLLVDAALRLIREGTIPTVEQAAAEAELSAATGYRYFPSRAALLAGAVEAAFPVELEHELEGDVLDRIEQVIEGGFPQLLENEVFDRAVLRLALEQWLEQQAGRKPEIAPVERPGRKALVAAIVDPLRDRLPEETLRRLELGLAMVLGIESYVVLSDIYGVGPGEAQQIWRWACAALVRAAEAEADVDEDSTVSRAAAAASGRSVRRHPSRAPRRRR